MKKKISQPKTEPKTIEWDKVSCCENCGNKEYYESSEMGISHRRFRLCTKCMSELLSYDLTLDESTGEYKATVPAPQKSSYSQSGHKYGGSVVATDDAGNSTTITQSDATFGENLLLRVLEKVAPTLAFTYPTAGAYITNATPVIKFKVTDNDSGVNPDTIVIKVDGAKVTTAFTKTAVTGGYECSYTPGTALADGAHTVSIEASDYDGNAASAKTVSFTVDTIPPTLTLTNPVDGLITNKAALFVSGKTDDVTSKPVTVTVNGASVTVNSDGSFSKEITLVSGSNTITVVATDKAGKTTTVTRKVTLDTGAPVFEKVTLTPNPVDCGKTFVISVKVTDDFKWKYACGNTSGKTSGIYWK